MTEAQHNPTELFARIHGFVAAMQSGQITPQDREEFESLICDNPQACDLFIRYMVTTSDLRAWASQAALESEEDLRIAKLFSTDVVTEVGQAAATEARSDGLLSPPIPIVVTSPAEGSHGALRFFAQEVPFSYLMSTLLLSIVLLIAWHWELPIHVHVATSSPSPTRSFANPESPFVGRITGMVDCQWSDSSTAAFHGAYVPLNRKYALASGLLEITYDTGAKVILQGPVTYEVESAAGGFLSDGKLTARVEKRSETASQKSKIKNQKSSLSTNHYPLFSIRTPTAIVTDLGTEFGVEVDESGRTESHVFVGTVKMQWLAAKAGLHESQMLHTGQTARCDKNKGIVVAAASGNVDRFVRCLQPGTTRMIKAFDGDELGAAFEQMPPGHYVFQHGAAVYRQPVEKEGSPSRGFIRTVAADFCDRDFVFEATLEVRLLPEDTISSRHWIFFGIGDGVPNVNFYDEVNNALILGFIVDNGRALVRLCHPDSTLAHPGGKIVAEVAPQGSLNPGRHRFRMWKSGKWVQFAVDKDFDGQSSNDFVSGSLALPAIAPLLNATNSRLLVGTGKCDTMTVRFENVSFSYTDTYRKAKNRKENP